MDCCWEKPYREAQYVAIDYLTRMKDFLVLEDIQKIKLLLVNKSWWDTVDGLHRVIGHVALKYPEVDKTMIQWSLDENFWLRRVAINHQMHWKEKMKEELLEEIIVNNLEQVYINEKRNTLIGAFDQDNNLVATTGVKGFVDRFEAIQGMHEE